MSRDFIDLNLIPPAELKNILALAHKMKKTPLAYRPMEGKTLALIFEKPSTRTRVSFEVGMRQLGGQVTTLTSAEIQLGHGETVSDTGKVLSRFVDIVMMRTFEAKHVTELAEGATIPVINGLTNDTHPCQVMADIMTVEEKLSTAQGKRAVWLGDGDNNVLNSWIHAAPVFGFALDIVCPPQYAPAPEVVSAAQKAGAKITVSGDPKLAEGADILITDCWVSMHNKDALERKKALQPYQVNESLMKRANPKAIFMHCLPAHRGEEVTDAVIDSGQSAVWDEAENRMHVQKAIICWCMNIDPA